jgi:dTDP-4-dehydrorhamnose reductase
MVKVAVSGASGLVGSRIIELLRADFSFIPLSQTTVDITKKDQVAQFFQDNQFDFFLHLAAYTNVDGAEVEKEKAYAINVEGTKNVFEQSVAKKINFIYISTDFVFDGKNPPFDEEAKPNPISYYALTKYQGEKVIGNEGMIVRIAYPYRAWFEPKKDFVRSLYHLLKENKQLMMVENALMTPTFIDDIAYGLNYLIQNYSKKIFHLVGSQSLSPYEAGRLIAEKFNLSQDLILAISYEEYFKNKAKRPQFSQIVSKKNHFHPMASFEEGLHQIAKMMI